MNTIVDYYKLKVTLLTLITHFLIIKTPIIEDINVKGIKLKYT